jgi:hypothetical protein
VPATGCRGLESVRSRRVFLDSSGIAVEAFLTRNGRTLDPPSIVDAFYLGLYPTVVAGLILLIVRRKARREWAASWTL